MNSDEHFLITRAKSGDTAAFEALVNQHARYVYNLALRLLDDPQEAENISQEAFLRVWRGLLRFRSEAKFTTWLYQIVTNLCYSRLPRLRLELETLELDEGVISLPEENPSVEDIVMSEELNHILHGLLDDMPDSFRLLLTLRHLQELSYTEIAEVTGMPIGTVKTGIHRARQQLRQRFLNFEATYG